MPSNKNKWVNVRPSVEQTTEKDNKSITSNHFQKDKNLFNKKAQNPENYYDMNKKNQKSKFAYLNNSRSRFENSTAARIMNSPQMQDDLSTKQPTKQQPMLNGSSKRPITTSTLVRPPSRHKTPNKALGLDTPFHLDKNKNLKQRPNTSKNVRFNSNSYNKKRESYEEDVQIPINNFREETDNPNLDHNPNEILNTDLINNEVEYDECLSNENKLLKNNEFTIKSKSSNSKFSATAQDKFQKDEESQQDQKFKKLSYGTKINFVENVNNFKNKSRKSQSQNNEKNKVLSSSLNKDFLDLFATK